MALLPDIILMTLLLQATIAMSLLLGLSVYWLRRYQYEMFLIVHIALSALVLVTMLG